MAATRGVLGSMLQLLEEGATHVGVATDHVIESFRNDLWPGYKTSEGMPPELLGAVPAARGGARRPPASPCSRWSSTRPTTPWRAAAAVAAADARVEQVLICTPDKDLGQCVVGDRVVQLDRRKGVVIDAAGVEEKFGVPPASIPDYLALVGDSADGFPGLPGWGAKSAAAVLARYGHLEDIPAAAADWDVTVRGARRSWPPPSRTSSTLALLFRRIATIEPDAPTIGDVDELRWTGPDPRAGGGGRAPRRPQPRGSCRAARRDAERPTGA